jgi:hypothetical protein
MMSDIDEDLNGVIIGTCSTLMNEILENAEAVEQWLEKLRGVKVPRKIKESLRTLKEYIRQVEQDVCQLNGE